LGGLASDPRSRCGRAPGKYDRPYESQTLLRRWEAPLRVLIFGYGFAGAWIHDPLIRSVPELEVAAVVTSNQERQQLARTRHPEIKVFGSPDDALREVEADIAVVASPNRYHVELALGSIERGMAVVIDKPVANNASETRYLIEQATRSGRTLTVFHNRRWDGDYLTVRELMAQGRLGEIHTLTSRFDRWVPDPKMGWRDESPDSGGGLLLDLGSHLVDQAIRALGPVHSVYADLQTLHPERRSDDWMFVSLLHLSGAHSHLHASALEGYPSLRYHISGSEGSFVKHGKDIQEERLLAGTIPSPGETGNEPRDMWGRIHRGEQVESVETIPGDWSAFYRLLVAHLTDRGPIPVAPNEVLEVMTVLDAARESAVNGSVISMEGRSSGRPKDIRP
jgi:scyllo-inositol 2-dehydrogenase (NADP+)